MDRRKHCDNYAKLMDHGPNPIVFNIDKESKANLNYRSALWTGEYMQLTLMSIRPGGDIGIEMHPDVDQFIRIEKGNALVMIGNTRDNLDTRRKVNSDYAVIIPAGTWHNIINTGPGALKLYSIYAPPQHPFGTIHETKEIAEMEGH